MVSLSRILLFFISLGVCIVGASLAFAKPEPVKLIEPIQLAANFTDHKRPASKQSQYLISKKPVVKKSKPQSFNKNRKAMVTKKTIHKPASLQFKNKSKKITYQKSASSKNIKIEKKIQPATKVAAVKPKRKPVIVLDPGHGGKDPGATGKLGTKEKNITLKYSLALKKELEKTGKYKVVLTRTSDKFITLPDRVKIARKAGGDVLISIHADSIENSVTRGFSVYTLSNKRKDDEAKKLLEKANREDVIIGANMKRESKDVQEAIIDFAQHSTKNISNDFAATIGKSLGKKIRPLKKNRREASLAVLTGADIPSVLIELGYLSNEYEERLLREDDHMKKVVTSITAAVNEYFSKFNLVF